MSVERGGGRLFQRRRQCRFCIDHTPIDFKDIGLLRNFLTERGRIVPRRVSGNCLRHQRDLTIAIKRARSIAMLAFAEEH
ncbi:MAG: 30S ribosomal protein S18 [Nitrospiraceae bacterium]